MVSSAKYVTLIALALVFVFQNVHARLQSSCTVEVDQDGAVGLSQAFDEFLNEINIISTSLLSSGSVS